MCDLWLHPLELQAPGSELWMIDKIGGVWWLSVVSSGKSSLIFYQSPIFNRLSWFPVAFRLSMVSRYFFKP